MGEVSMNYVESEVLYNRSSIKCEKAGRFALAPPGFDVLPTNQEFEDVGRSNVLSTYERSIGQHLVEDASASPICPAPLCRQFWKAGDYNDMLSSKPQIQNSKSHMRIHPKFLHSNATSHKWAFGAIAELLDNAIDEIQNGSTFVNLDKITNPRDGNPSLLIQDDGGGMDPEAIRRCMSFGFSDKQSESTIGKYGNGFKTSTMRLGADAIVFSRHMGNRALTQSIGLLSYTYLTRTGLDRIVVPMVDYEYNMSTKTFEPLNTYGGENFQLNLSIILGWSPYTTLEELMKQFDDIGLHGTKVIVFNLWLTDEGELEFDFESDPKDIRLPRSDDQSKRKLPSTVLSEHHIGNQYRYSLRVYMSILYLRIPPTFRMLLRGVVVEHHCIVRDLKFPEVIMYKPQTGKTKEGEVLTTIGFLKEAPDIYIHGFNVYHKNRLILPFWQVVSFHQNRGKGVVGLLEADFIEPTHNKQDFERTSLFQKLETRLKDMTWEYWDHHCGLIGYHINKKIRATVSSKSSSYVGLNKSSQHHALNKASSFGLGPNKQPRPLDSIPAGSTIHDSQAGIQQPGIKRTRDEYLPTLDRGSKQVKAGPKAPNATNEGDSLNDQSVPRAFNASSEPEVVALMQENKKLLAKCLQYEKNQEVLNHKISRLRKETEEARQEYVRMLDEYRQSIEVGGGNVRAFESSRSYI